MRVIWQAGLTPSISNEGLTKSLLFQEHPFEVRCVSGRVNCTLRTPPKMSAEVASPRSTAPRSSSRSRSRCGLQNRSASPLPKPRALNHTLNIDGSPSREARGQRLITSARPYTPKQQFKAPKSLALCYHALCTEHLTRIFREHSRFADCLMKILLVGSTRGVASRRLLQNAC